jgi:hypothetical protein
MGILVSGEQKAARLRELVDTLSRQDLTLEQSRMARSELQTLLASISSRPETVTCPTLHAREGMRTQPDIGNLPAWRMAM